MFIYDPDLHPGLARWIDRNILYGQFLDFWHVMWLSNVTVLALQGRELNCSQLNISAQLMFLMSVCVCVLVCTDPEITSVDSTETTYYEINESHDDVNETMSPFITSM